MGRGRGPLGRRGVGTAGRGGREEGVRRGGEVGWAGEVGEVWLIQVWVTEEVCWRAWWRSAVLLLKEVSMGAAWSGCSMF